MLWQGLLAAGVSVSPYHFRQPGANPDTFTYDYRGRIKSHSRAINGRAYAMTVNEFDELDRPLWTDYDYPGSSQDETILHRYDRHFENSLLIMGTASLVNSLTYNHRGQLTRLNRPGSVQDTRYTYYGAPALARSSYAKRLWPASFRQAQCRLRCATFGNGRSLWAYLNTLTYDYRGRIQFHSN